MTERLYYTDAYLARFRASVVDTADGGRTVYLDRSAFYPTSGGQPNDLGRLGDADVVDVVDEGDRVAHHLSAPLATGEVEGVIDWARRFDLMQQHTGQHLLSAVLEEMFGWPTVSVHFGAAGSTLDVDVGSVAPEALVAAEARANAVVWENRPVTVAFEGAATATGLRKATERSGTLRIVTIADLDRSACGGTHVRATGEIGAILLRRTERVKQLTRIEFLCGGRAVARARRDMEALGGIAAGFSSSLDDVPALVARQRDALAEALGAKKALQAELATRRAEARHAAAAPEADGVRRIRLELERADLDELRAEMQALAALPKVVGTALVLDPPMLLVAASADSGTDAGSRLKAALATVGGKGGGSPRFAQGTAPSRDALTTARNELTR
ncbi:MAG TPA: alanyl-tRNA editing protein [Gemmatimonadales bacterium]|nr:alanyl-tRNA editing protein [Gemmatimonadales bacterium]